MMGIYDLLIAPIAFGILLVLVIQYSNNRFSDQQERQYFQLAFIFKCFGAIALGLIFQFYYQGGDTFNYFDNAKYIHSAFYQSPMTGLQLIFGKAGEVTPDNAFYAQFMYFYREPASYFVVRVAGFFSILCGGSYATVALFFAFISFTGVWCIYKVFATEYPYLKKQLAWAILFFPSLIFWGSGVMKDTLCLAAVGWAFYAFYKMMNKPKNWISTLLLFLLGAYILVKVKIYIAMCILPSMLLWWVIRSSLRIKSAVIRAIFIPLAISIAIGIGLVATTQLSSINEDYSLENITETAALTQFYIKRVSAEGSYYELSGVFDGSLGSIVRLAPEAIIVSFFRPFLPEARNPVMLISGIENTIILSLFIYALVKLFSSQYIKTKPNGLMAFCFVFSLLFGLAIGLTSSNFGTLVRYKIPMLPFLTPALVILVFKNAGIKAAMKKARIAEAKKLLRKHLESLAQD